MIETFHAFCGRVTHLIVQVIVVLLLIAPHQSYAEQVFQTSSIHVDNRSPFLMLFGLSRPHVTSLLQDEQWRYNARFELSNYLSAHRGSKENIFIDGETWILSQSLEFNWQDYQIGVMIPWLKHGPGKLDRSIYTFHDLLQLPQNGRTDDRHDEIYWRLEMDSNEISTLNQSTHRLGDIQLHLTTALNNPQWQINAMLKLPSGRFSKQSGSEALDAGIAFSQANPDWLAKRSWLSKHALSFWWGSGLTYVGKSDKLDAMDQYPLAATFRVGMAWKSTEHWQIKGQLDSNSPLFDSEIRELGWMPVQASLSGQYRFSDTRYLSATIIEDLRPRVTPDVIFSFEFSTLF